MTYVADISASLRETVEKIAHESKARAVAVALLDFESGFQFSLAGNRWFHAASTIKVAVLLAVLHAADEGRLRLDDPLHVRNRFIGAAGGVPFRLDADSDAMPELYRAIGRTVEISELAEAMIAASSNLATNLLLDLVGVEYARNALRDAEVSGVELRRGVEDHAAHENGMDNEVTADGLLTLLCALRGDFLSYESREHAIRILLAQRFNSMIPAGLPAHATVAHKTGEISTACHDMGIVYLPERQPYITVILTEFDPENDGRREIVAAISETIHRALTEIGRKGQ
jgi:beta-lactamase class A